jgi:NitT/TauT family transport system substrate-binding protein
MAGAAFSWLLLAALAASTPAAAQELKPVRFGSVGGITDAGIFLADYFGYFKEAGLAVSMKRQPGSPAIVAALASGQLEVGGAALSPALFAAAEQGMGIRIVGDKSGYRLNYTPARLLVTAKMAGATPKEALVGKTIAISSVASVTHYSVKSILEASGISLKDVKLKELSYPSMVLALASGAVDAAYLIEPFLSEALHRKAGVEIGLTDLGTLAERDEPGSSFLGVPLVYSEKFIEDRAAAQGFMDAYVKGVRAYNDAFTKNINKDEVIKALEKYSKTDAELIRNSYPAGLHPDQEINMKTLDRLQEFFVEGGYLKQAVPLDKVVDMSFAKESVKRLGPYSAAK